MNPPVTLAAGPSRPWHLGALWAVIGASAITAGCSAPTAYATGQAWQQGQCNRIIDMQERERCMAPTRQPYDRYRQEADSLKQAPAD